MKGRVSVSCARLLTAVILLSAPSLASAQAGDIVLHATDVSTIKGRWARVDSPGAAINKTMSSTNEGWASVEQPQAGPNDYFEATFTAQAWVPYRLWLRMRATADSKWNDSVWVQFGDSLDASGAAAYRTGTTSGILVNLESCNGCGVAGWGWTNSAWWKAQDGLVQFASAGTKTIRIQTREDGAQIDQIVLSPVTYLAVPPGAEQNDTTILPRAGSADVAAATVAKAIPGTIQAEDFDGGASGVAYYDRTSGNSGGQYRSTDVDIEASAEGGYDIGWTESGEWLRYTVNVASAGSYTLELRAASPGGASLHVEFNGADVTGSMSVPATGGWQSWTTIRKTVNLAAGSQVMRVVFDTAGTNFNYIKAISSSTSSESGSGPFGGTARAVPGTIQAEDFDLGGSGVGYRDNTAGNSGGKYRSTDVDIEATGDAGGGYNVGWVGAGEWLKYTVNVSTVGTYTLAARVASSGSGGSFHVEFNGANKTGTLSVPNTGGWQSYRDVTATVSLSAGVQTMRLVFDANGATGAIGNVNYVRLSAGTSAPPPSTGKLRVMTWNIHFGKNASNVLNLEGQAKVMADSGADVILLQEGSTWDGDQPNRFPQLLQQYTGRTWYSFWSPNNTSTGLGQGTIILSKYSLTATTKANFEGTGAARIQIDVGGVRVNVLDVHLEYYDKSKRTRQLNAFMSWARNYGGPRIAGGDFNSWWGESWIKTMETEYSDTWQDVTGSDENGYTKNNVRFDYLFRAFDQNSRLTPTACWVISTSASDHRPVVADYSVK